MTEPTTLISLRLPSELVQKLDSEAATRSRPGAKVTRTDVIAGAIGVYFQHGVIVPNAEQTLMGDDPGQMPFKCPGTGCNRRFGSKAAVCPTHGRKAVPV